jgi:hypothetical protein
MRSFHVVGSVMKQLDGLKVGVFARVCLGGWHGQLSCGWQRSCRAVMMWEPRCAALQYSTQPHTGAWLCPHLGMHLHVNMYLTVIYTWYICDYTVLYVCTLLNTYIRTYVPWHIPACTWRSLLHNSDRLLPPSCGCVPGLDCRT